MKKKEKAINRNHSWMVEFFFLPLLILTLENPHVLVSQDRVETDLSLSEQLDAGERLVDEREEIKVLIDQLEELTFYPNRRSYILIPDIVKEFPSVDEMREMKSKNNYEEVFGNLQYSDNEITKGCRFLQRLESVPPYLKELLNIFKEFHHLALIWSDDKTKRQDDHVDYPAFLYEWPPLYLPLVGIVAIEENVRISINGTIVPIEKGNCLAMTGNTPHQGLEWKQCNGARFHFYRDTMRHKSNPEENGFLNLFQVIKSKTNDQFFDSFICFVAATPSFRSYLDEMEETVIEGSLPVIRLVAKIIQGNMNNEEEMREFEGVRDVVNDWDTTKEDINEYIMNGCKYFCLHSYLNLPTISYISLEGSLNMDTLFGRCNYPSILHITVVDQEQILNFNVEINNMYYEMYFFIMQNSMSKEIFRYRKNYYTPKWCVIRSGKEHNLILKDNIPKKRGLKVTTAIYRKIMD